MLDLSNITLIGITTRDYFMQSYAIHRCTSLCKFKNVVVFTDKPSCFPTAECVIIPPMSWSGDVSIHNLTTMVQNRHLYGDYTLNIHSDSWIINPSMWTDEFYKYDYIGARWPDNVVGNDGFGFKTKRFWDELAAIPFEPTLECCNPADVVMCRQDNSAWPKCWRNHLEERGMKWASPELADRFSVEMEELPFDKCFGFHGRFVLPAIVAREKHFIDDFRKSYLMPS